MKKLIVVLFALCCGCGSWVDDGQVKRGVEKQGQKRAKKEPSSVTRTCRVLIKINIFDHFFY